MCGSFGPQASRAIAPPQRPSAVTERIVLSTRSRAPLAEVPARQPKVGFRLHDPRCDSSRADAKVRMRLINDLRPQWLFCRLSNLVALDGRGDVAEALAPLQAHSDALARYEWCGSGSRQLGLDGTPADAALGRILSVGTGRSVHSLGALDGIRNPCAYFFTWQATGMLAAEWLRGDAEKRRAMEAATCDAAVAGIDVLDTAKDHLIVCRATTLDLRPTLGAVAAAALTTPAVCPDETLGVAVLLAGITCDDARHFFTLPERAVNAAHHEAAETFVRVLREGLGPLCGVEWRTVGEREVCGPPEVFAKAEVASVRNGIGVGADI